MDNPAFWISVYAALVATGVGVVQLLNYRRSHAERLFISNITPEPLPADKAPAGSRDLWFEIVNDSGFEVHFIEVEVRIPGQPLGYAHRQNRPDKPYTIAPRSAAPFRGPRYIAKPDLPIEVKVEMQSGYSYAVTFTEANRPRGRQRMRRVRA